MIVIEHKKIELDYCLQCSGVWLDSGELELLMSVLESKGAKSSQSEMLKFRGTQVSEDIRRCPICGHKMEKVCLGKEPEVLVDKCSKGDGLWFDAGELQQVLRKMALPHTEPRDVITFLDEAFEATHHAGKEN